MACSHRIDRLRCKSRCAICPRQKGDHSGDHNKRSTHRSPPIERNGYRLMVSPIIPWLPGSLANHRTRLAQAGSEGPPGRFAVFRHMACQKGTHSAASLSLGRHTRGLDWGPRGALPEPVPAVGGTIPGPPRAARCGELCVPAGGGGSAGVLGAGMPGDLRRDDGQARVAPLARMAARTRGRDGGRTQKGVCPHAVALSSCKFLNSRSPGRRHNPAGTTSVREFLEVSGHSISRTAAKAR
jgi:hypothetical protein